MRNSKRIRQKIQNNARRRRQTKMARKISNRVFCWTVSVVLLVGSSAALAADSVTFPGNPSEVKSPNGLYTIKNFDYPIGNVNYPNHILFFLRKGQKKGLALNVRQ